MDCSCRGHSARSPHARPRGTAAATSPHYKKALFRSRSKCATPPSKTPWLANKAFLASEERQDHNRRGATAAAVVAACVRRQDTVRRSSDHVSWATMCSQLVSVSTPPTGMCLQVRQASGRVALRPILDGYAGWRPGKASVEQALSSCYRAQIFPQNEGSVIGDCVDVVLKRPAAVAQKHLRQALEQPCNSLDPVHQAEIYTPESASVSASPQPTTHIPPSHAQSLPEHPDGWRIPTW